MDAFETFGKNFIVSNASKFSPFYNTENTLLVHTCCALELLGYIEILSMKFIEERRDEPDYGYVVRYCINILPNESFKQLIYNEYRKEHPDMTINGFDPKTGVLKFAGKEIALSKSKKETDATLLINSLMNVE